jgi:hypothetical protein
LFAATTAQAGLATLPPRTVAVPRPPTQLALADGTTPWLLADAKPRTANVARSAADTPTPPRAPVAEPLSERTRASVVTVSGPGSGQAGTVHYFVIKRPNGVLESHIGIEMPDQRIAWSFPEIGASVSPFIKSGTVTVRGKSFVVQHLYGIRPFPDDASMRALQYELEARVMVFADDATPHCDPEVRGKPFCMSCLGFVLRVLFPGKTPAYPAVPRDFQRANAGAYSTEDLLLYLAGLQGLGEEAQVKRITDINPPVALREELLRLVGIHDADTATTAAKPEPASKGRRVGTRPVQRKKL